MDLYPSIELHLAAAWKVTPEADFFWRTCISFPANPCVEPTGQKRELRGDLGDV
jgi:hypothetical protein